MSYAIIPQFEVWRYSKLFSVSNNTILFLGLRGSKGLSDEIVKSTPTTANILNPLLNYVGTKIRVKFKGSCLKQHEISCNRGKIVNIYIFYEINKNLNISS